jgi:hypothetical protein
VRFTLAEIGGEHTRLTFEEAPASGVLKLAWTTLGRPLMRLGIWGRNARSLDRLKAYVESGGTGAPEAAAGGDSDERT